MVTDNRQQLRSGRRQEREAKAELNRRQSAAAKRGGTYGARAGSQAGAVAGQAAGSVGGGAVAGGAGGVVGGIRGAIAGAPAGGVGAIPGAIAGAAAGAAEYGAKGAKQGGTFGRRFGRKAGKYAGRKTGEQAAGRLARAASVDQQAKLKIAQARQRAATKSSSKLTAAAAEGDIDTAQLVTKGVQILTTGVFSVIGWIIRAVSALVGIGMMFALAFPPLAVVLFIVLLMLGFAAAINKFMAAGFKQTIGVFEKATTIVRKNT